jgi:hypothetical protein
VKLYKVTFTFNEAYRPKMEMFCSIELVVAADTQFTALAIAWDKIKVLNLDEPKSFNAQRYDEC